MFLRTCCLFLRSSPLFLYVLCMSLIMTPQRRCPESLTGWSHTYTHQTRFVFVSKITSLHFYFFLTYTFFYIVCLLFHTLQGGYTFVAEAHTGDSPVFGGQWRMRLIGSREPLPQLARETPSNIFSVKELKGYYIPNQKNIICRLAHA